MSNAAIRENSSSPVVSRPTMISSYQEGQYTLAESLVPAATGNNTNNNDDNTGNDTNNLDSATNSHNLLQEPQHCGGRTTDDTAATGEFQPPWFYDCIPRFFRYDNGPVEATAIALNNFSRGIIAMSSIYIGPALLELAKQQGDEECAGEDDCEGRVYGFRPSSLLTNIATISGIVTALALPVAGAIIDHTPHRRRVGLVAGLTMAVIKAIEVGISPKTWFFMAWLQLVSAVLFQLLTVVECAYAAELSSAPKQQTKYQTHFFLVMLVSIFLYMLQVLIPGKKFALDDVNTARLGAGLSAAWTTPVFSLCWWYRPRGGGSSPLFPDRPALTHVPHNQSLFRAGFVKLHRTYHSIRSDFPAVRWFLCSALFGEAANWSFNTVAVTYFKEFLGLSSLRIGLVVMVLLLGGIPGTFIGKHLSTRYDPLASVKASLAVFVVTTTCATYQLTAESPGYLPFVYAFLWGVCKGWFHPILTTLYVTIIPKGQEAEMMGLYFFAAHIFTFLPPAVFTILNEAGLSMNLGMSSLNVFFVLGWVFLNRISDYQASVVQY